MTPRTLLALILPLLCLQVTSPAMAAERSLADSLEQSISFLMQAKDRIDRSPLDSLARTQLDLRVSEIYDWADARPTLGPLKGRDWLLLGDLMAWLSNFGERYAYDRCVNAYKHAGQDPEIEWEAFHSLLTAYEKVGFAPGVVTTGERLVELDSRMAREEKVEYSLAVAHFKLGNKQEAQRWIKRYLKHHRKDPEGRSLKQRIRKELR